MRRVLLGGLGIALGVLVRPASADDYPKPSAPMTSANFSVRAARLGVPVADSDPSPGLNPRPLLSPTPTVGAPVAIDAPSLEGVAAPLELPAPRIFGGTPNLNEVRGPVSGGVPISPGVPTPGLEDFLIPTVTPLNDPIGSPLAGMPALANAPAARNPRWWSSAEYLMWWTKSTQLPTLVTTSPPASNGILGAPDTVSVLGGSFGQTIHSGGRFGGGWWFNDNQTRGIDTSFFFLFGNSANFTANTAEYPVLARPFFNINAPFGPYSELVGTPGLANGTVAAHLDNSLWGAQINYRSNLFGNGCFRVDGLAGFRYMNLTENLSITESFLRTPDSPMTVGTPAISGQVNDSFRAVNNFYGGQVGLTGEVRRGRWFANARSTIAFGTVSQTATIGGGQALYFANGTVGQYPGGLLAVPGANIGSFSQNKFAVLPELGLNIGYHITPRLRVFGGYNFLYLSNVLRASGTIDTVVDAARIPNFPLPGSPAPLTSVTRPAPQFHDTDFWAQGISCGLQFSW